MTTVSIEFVIKAWLQLNSITIKNWAPQRLGITLKESTAMYRPTGKIASLDGNNLIVGLCGTMWCSVFDNYIFKNEVIIFR